jgi:hypothetical protein
MPRTLFGKMRKPVEQGGEPYAVYQLGDVTIQVLKTYQHHDNEGLYSRWMTAGSGPNTFGSLDMGDDYADRIRKYGRLISATPEWREAYND